MVVLVAGRKFNLPLFLAEAAKAAGGGIMNYYNIQNFLKQMKLEEASQKSLEDYRKGSLEEQRQERLSREKEAGARRQEDYLGSLARLGDTGAISDYLERSTMGIKPQININAPVERFQGINLKKSQARKEISEAAIQKSIPYREAQRTRQIGEAGAREDLTKNTENRIKTLLNEPDALTPAIIEDMSRVIRENKLHDLSIYVPLMRQKLSSYKTKQEQKPEESYSTAENTFNSYWKENITSKNFGIMPAEISDKDNYAASLYAFRKMESTIDPKTREVFKSKLAYTLPKIDPDFKGYTTKDFDDPEIVEAALKYLEKYISELPEGELKKNIGLEEIINWLRNTFKSR